MKANHAKFANVFDVVDMDKLDLVGRILVDERSSRAAPFFDEREVKLSIVLTDRGTKYCGNPEHHEYEPYLAVEDIDHSRTKTKSPQTNEAIADG